MLEIAIYLRNKRLLDRLLRRTAVLQMGGVVVVFQKFDPIGEAECHRQLDLILIFVRTVASALLGFPILDVGQGGISDDLSHIVGQTVFITEGFLCKSAVLLFHPQ